ncbi:hypothetical protein OROMI_009968 [Orobanche minor]
MNSKVAFRGVFVLFLVFVLGAIEVITTTTTTSVCNTDDLNPCRDVIEHPEHDVSDDCCNARNAQKTECLCFFMKNATLQPYVNSPGAVKISKVCKAPYPNCTT